MRFVCPDCGAGGGDSTGHLPLCYVCNYDVLMLPAHNNTILWDKVPDYKSNRVKPDIKPRTEGVVMSVTKEQIKCSGHDWGDWDKRSNRTYVDTCQCCWVEMPDWLEYVEDQKIELEKAARAVVEEHRHWEDTTWDSSYPTVEALAALLEGK